MVLHAQWIALLWCAVLAERAQATQRSPLVPAPHFRAVARVIADRLPQEHLTGRPLDNTISRRAFQKYLDFLDPSRLYFLESDIAAFRVHEFTLDDELSDGDVSFAFDVFKVFVERVRNRTEYVARLLQQDLDLTADETYTWSRKKAPWSKDEKAWDELWRLVVKNELVSRLVAEEQPEDEPAETPAPEREEPTPAPPKGREPVPPSAAEQDGVSGEPRPPGRRPTPKDLTLKRHQQYLTFVESHDAEWVLERYLMAFTQAYDPHCEYFSPALVKDFEIEMKLSLCGIGAVLSWDEGYIRVTRILPGGPADRDKRLKPGDRIVAVGQADGPEVDVFGWPLYKTVQLIRGPKGTRVTLLVIPASDPSGTSRMRIELIREEIKLEEQAARSDVQEVTREGRTWRCGIIRLPAFYGDVEAGPGNPDRRSASRDVDRLLRELHAKGVDGIVLDLRGNGGGSLLEAVRMTGLFIRQGPVVQVRRGRSISIIPDNDPTVRWTGPLVVLINHATASSSEILAAALQDYGRAVLVGDSTTHGKGSVQTLVRLGDEERYGRLKVTNALFYRVSGGSTQLRGVSSDIVLPSLTESLEIGEIYLDHALEWSSVPPTRYPVLAVLPPIVAELRERSRRRLESQMNFSSYTNLLARVAHMRKEETVPLALEKRKALTETWRELNRLQKTVLSHPDQPQTDLVLREALQIVADLAELWPKVNMALEDE